MIAKESNQLGATDPAPHRFDWAHASVRIITYGPAPSVLRWIDAVMWALEDPLFGPAIKQRGMLRNEHLYTVRHIERVTGHFLELRRIDREIERSR